MSLHGVPCTIFGSVGGRWSLAVFVRRNDGFGASAVQPRPQGLAVIALVGDHLPHRRQRCQALSSQAKIACLTGSWGDHQRPPLIVGDEVDLDGAPAARATNALPLCPLFRRWRSDGVWRCPTRKAAWSNERAGTFQSRLGDHDRPGKGPSRAPAPNRKAPEGRHYHPVPGWKAVHGRHHRRARKCITSVNAMCTSRQMWRIQPGRRIQLLAGAFFGIVF